MSSRFGSSSLKCQVCGTRLSFKSPSVQSHADSLHDILILSLDQYSTFSRAFRSWPVISAHRLPDVLVAEHVAAATRVRIYDELMSYAGRHQEPSMRKHQLKKALTT